MRLFALTAIVAFSACADADAPAPAADAAAAPSVLAPEALFGRLPTGVAGLPRVAASRETDGAMGYEVARATATYAADSTDASGPRVVLTVLDLGTATMAEQMGFGWGLDGGTPDTTLAGFPALVYPTTPGGETGIDVLVAGRFFVEAKGTGVPMETTETAIRALDVSAFATLAAE